MNSLAVSVLGANIEHVITLRLISLREVSSVHELTVSCRDRGRQENADFARVAVTVEDANDHEPVFLEPMIIAKVSTLLLRRPVHRHLSQHQYMACELSAELRNSFR